LPPGTPIVLAHDHGEDPSYLEYLTAVRERALYRPAWRVSVRETHGHLSGNIRCALEGVTTPYVLIVQHDMPFTRPVDVMSVVRDMERDRRLLHVRFNWRRNVKAGCDADNWLWGEEARGGENVYTRTPMWSCLTHLCPTEYYRRVVLEEVPDGYFPENVLRGRATDVETHARYGTYVYGGLGAEACVKHTDGRAGCAHPPAPRRS